MTPLLEFFSRLRRSDIAVWAEGGQLQYSAPPGAMTADLREELRARKAEILRFLQGSNRGAAIAAPPITVIPRQGELPLSFAQQRLWLIDRLEPDSSLYNIPFGLRLTGPLDVAVLARCLSEVVRRHEVLRTTFRTPDEEPVQRISAALPLTLPLIDLSGLPAAEREAAVRRHLAQESQRPFNLSEDVMLRALLLRLDEQEHVCFLSIHHIAGDGWSRGVLFRELTALYAAFSRGQPSPLADLPIQYADFAVWQRKWLQGDVLKEQLAYWKRHLADAQPVLELPMDHPRPAIQAYRGDRECLVFDKGLSEAVRQLSRKEGATDFMTLLAAFQTLLYRYSGQDDVVVGTPIAGRNRVEIEQLIGLFVNTLALRTDLSGNPTFRELLARVRETTIGAYAHQDLPFEKLVDELNPERNLGHAPLFQVMFVLQNAPRETFHIPGLRVSAEAVENNTAKFDLTLAMTADEQELSAVLEYNTDLFERGTIQRMLGQFQRLLEGIAADPDQRIDRLPLLTEAQRQQMLVEWNDTRMDYPSDRCAHELFEEQVEQSPEAVALAFGDQRLSYSELNRRSNQLARYLRTIGVGPEVLVGLHLGRGVEMIVGLLGVWKAGGAYLPLDPAYPADRLAFMIDDAGLQLILTEESRAGGLAGHSARTVCLDSQWGAIGEEQEENLSTAVAPDHLAYVIYTSGSTGRPKGVQLAHRGLVNVSGQYVRLLGINRQSRILQFSSLNFDASVSEIVMALCSGGTLCLAEKDELLAGPQLLEKLRRLGITHLTIPPSSLAALPYGELPALRVMCVAGEACPAELVSRWGLGRRLLNLYGPTETTIWATWYECGAESGPPPIGRPIGNIRVYVLDRNGQVAPVGVPGELHLGGVGLARGYLNRPELTAEKFIASPIPGALDARLYRTGDLVRYRPDGNLEYLGRLDHQVKIRGFRIELGEIESCLRRHPAIQDAVLVAREDSPGDKRLVAYLVANGEEMPATADLRSYLKQDLPEFMVPSTFITLKAMPLMPSGKVDRRALPAPDAGRPELEHAYTAPRTQVEVMLAKIWAEMLGLEQVGIHDNFFELGGNSLLAARVVDRVQKIMRKPVPLAIIFRAPTIAELARHVASDDGNAFELLEPIRPNGNAAVVLCFGGGLMEHLPNLVPPRHPLYWCRPEHVDGKRSRYSEVEDLAAHYCREISAAALQGPYILCGFSFGGLVAFETARQLYERDRASTLSFLLEPSLPDPFKKSAPSKIAHHLGNLSSMPRGQRISYVYAKAKAGVQLARRWIRQFYCGIRLAFGFSLPVNMRWPFVEDLYRQATIRYVPRPFPGKVVLVQRREYRSDYLEQWARLAEGGFTLHEMCSSDHGDLVASDQAIAQWADLLQRHLNSPAESSAFGPKQPALTS